MTNIETLVLAKVILDRQVRYEELALGAHMREVAVVDPELLTGKRQEALRAFRPGAPWPDKSLVPVAWRANLYSKLAEDELTEALHFLQLRPLADIVLHALFALEEACSRLEREHRALWSRENVHLAERSGESRIAAARSGAGDAAAAPSSAPRAEKAAESEERTGRVPPRGRPAETNRPGSPAAPKFSRVMTPPPKPSRRP